MNPELVRTLAFLGNAVRALLAALCRLVEIVAGILARLIAG